MTRHVLEGLQKGLGDTTVFHAGRVPLQNLSFVTPFVSADPVLFYSDVGCFGRLIAGRYD